MMDIYMICLSLKYINDYKNIIGLSKWIKNELTIINYNDQKLIKSLDKQDFEVIKLIINFVENKSILDKYLCREEKISIDIIKLLLKFLLFLQYMVVNYILILKYDYHSLTFYLAQIFLLVLFHINLLVLMFYQ